MISKYLCALALASVLSPLVQAEAAANDTFEWGVIGDSWSTGVAYSPETIWSHLDFKRCSRTTEAWGAVMARTNWTEAEQEFFFLACGGARLEDMGKQVATKHTPRLLLGTIGGNNAMFGSILRACVYHPRMDHPRGGKVWGAEYAADTNGAGACKQALLKTRTYIENSLADEFRRSLDDILAATRWMLDDGLIPRFDLYISGYVEFFNAETDACDDWSFSGDIASRDVKPRLVKPLRREMNELTAMLNSVQESVIKAYQSPHPDAHVGYLQPSAAFEGHRFCEPGHSLPDQFYSSDVWIWNLQFSKGDLGANGTDEHAKPNTDEERAKVVTKDGVSYINEPLTPLHIFGHHNHTAREARKARRGDLYNYAGTDIVFGWLSRPFHPKPLGHRAMAEYFIRAIAADHVPGVRPIA